MNKVEICGKMQYNLDVEVVDIMGNLRIYRIFLYIIKTELKLRQTKRLKEK